MKASEAVLRLQALVAKHGDADLVCEDLDTKWVIPLRPTDFRAQRLADGSIRFAVNPIDYKMPPGMEHLCSLEEAAEDYIDDDV